MTFCAINFKEHVSEWFEMDLDVPYMGVVLKINKTKRQKLPAVTHLDGTGRLPELSKKIMNYIII